MSCASQERFNATQVTISGLNPVTTYRFQVFAENGVSKQAPEAQYLDITVTTEASGKPFLFTHLAGSCCYLRAANIKLACVSYVFALR